VFQTEIRNTEAPNDILGPLQVAYSKAELLAWMLGGTGLPIAVQGVVVPIEKLEIVVDKAGQGLRRVYSNADQI
jgi:hypothetical protein